MEYTDSNRGVIQFRKRRQQIIIADRIRYGNITPSDIDGWFEYRNKGHWFIELKYKDALPSKAQILGYKRLANDLEKGGKPAIVIYAKHIVHNVEEDIDMAACIVRRVYFRGEYYVFNNNEKVKDITDWFTNWLDGKTELFLGHKSPNKSIS